MKVPPYRHASPVGSAPEQGELSHVRPILGGWSSENNIAKILKFSADDLSRYCAGGIDRPQAPRSCQSGCHPVDCVMELQSNNLQIFDVCDSWTQAIKLFYSKRKLYLKVIPR